MRWLPARATAPGVAKEIPEQTQMPNRVEETVQDCVWATGQPGQSTDMPGRHQRWPRETEETAGETQCWIFAHYGFFGSFHAEEDSLRGTGGNQTIRSVIYTKLEQCEREIHFCKSFSVRIKPSTSWDIFLLVPFKNLVLLSYSDLWLLLSLWLERIFRKL